ncbi:hypothetical protein CAP35_07645 [Chitinophagaceae bacterium IBVUCB1]|nr:hypothetical protein CAP35_07645 [Chitinophagaceae bacterium IBVUCB1]
MATTTKKKAAPKVRLQPSRIRKVAAEWMPQNGKDTTNAIVMTTLAVGAAGIIGYFGWQYYKKKRGQKTSNLEEELIRTTPTSSNGNSTNVTLPSGETIPITNTNSSGGGKATGKKNTGGGSTYTPPSYNDDFPLKKGSKGASVKSMQQALISKYGKSLLPKYGADGDFGTETTNALKKLGLPTIVDESTYNVILQGGSKSSGSGTSSTTTSLSAVAKKLYSAAVARNFATALSLLKQLKSQDDYSQASEAFKQYRLRGVRQTLVNGMLNTFTTNDQKQKIRFEFIRMGLKYDGSKWSLSGFDGRPVVTKETTTVWVNPTQSLQVPPMMVLGIEVGQRLDYTMFENNSRFFLVQTRAIKYL